MIPRASFFTGANGDGAEVAPAREIAREIAKNPKLPRELDYGLLFSAAAFLIRDGQRTDDVRVIDEAKRRLPMAKRANEKERWSSRG